MPLSDLSRIVLVLAITLYIPVKAAISIVRLDAATSNLLLSIRSVDSIASADAKATNTPPMVMMLFIASFAKYDKPSSVANTTPRTPIAAMPCHIFSAGK